MSVVDLSVCAIGIHFRMLFSVPLFHFNKILENKYFLSGSKVINIRATEECRTTQTSEWIRSVYVIFYLNSMLRVLCCTFHKQSTGVAQEQTQDNSLSNDLIHY